VINILSRVALLFYRLLCLSRVFHILLLSEFHCVYVPKAGSAQPFSGVPVILSGLPSAARAFGIKITKATLLTMPKAMTYILYSLASIIRCYFTK
jgi:hypothetical protein